MNLLRLTKLEFLLYFAHLLTLFILPLYLLKNFNFISKNLSLVLPVLINPFPLSIFPFQPNKKENGRKMSGLKSALLTTFIQRNNFAQQKQMSMKPRILVTDSTVKVPKLHELGEVCQYVKEGQMPRELLLEKVADVDAIFCLLRDKIDREFLEHAKKLRMVGTMSVGYEHIDVPECRKRGIRIGYTPGVLTDATAELAMSLLLTTARRLPEAIQSAKSGGWKTWSPYYMCGKTLVGAVVGIYGLGKIGANIAEKLLPFKPRKIIYHNRHEIEGCSHKYVQFEELLRESDFLLICAKPSTNNIRIFNKNAFAQMKKDSILVNVSRGILVDLNDLRMALKSGAIGAAGLDVTDPEPLPIEHPLFQMDNCVILPHIGSATYATRNLMASTTEQNIYNFLTDKPMVAELDEDEVAPK